jgi:hypothetical protein
MRPGATATLTRFGSQLSSDGSRPWLELRKGFGTALAGREIGRSGASLRNSSSHSRRNRIAACFDRCENRTARLRTSFRMPEDENPMYRAAWLRLSAGSTFHVHREGRFGFQIVGNCFASFDISSLHKAGCDIFSS